MAINPETQYPGKINPSDASYPYGSARNVSSPGDGTGTPWEAALVNDLFGFLQKILTDGAVVPSGSPETILVSQYMEALRQLDDFVQIVSNGAGGFGIIVGDSTETVATIGIGSVILGGYVDANKNRMPGTRDLRAILAGYDNEITQGTGGDDGGLACVIVGSHHSEILADSTHATILGGSTHFIRKGDYGSVLGGLRNEIKDTARGGGAQVADPDNTFMAGGQDNLSFDSNNVNIGGVRNETGGDFAISVGGKDNISDGIFNTVSGGGDNEARLGTSGNGQKNTIAGGRTNIIDSVTNALSNTISGGENNKANGTHNSVGGGDGNEGGTVASNATYAAIPGGLDNKVSAGTAGAVGGGRLNEAAGDYSGVTHGRECKSTAIYSRAGGHQAEATLDGFDFLADGQFTALGDAQTAVGAQKVETADATPLSMGALVLPDDTTWMFQVNIVARRADVNGESAAYTITGCIKRDTGVGSTALVGAPTVTVIAEDTAAWDVAANANTGAGALSIDVTGEAAKTIRWASRVMLSQVSG